MNDGLRKTFELLRQTENEAAVNVLLIGLDSPDARIREASLRAILERSGNKGQDEIVRRLHTFDESWKQIIVEHRGHLTQALRNAVLSPDELTCANGNEATIWSLEYDLMPTLVTAAEDSSNPHSARCAATLLTLAEKLYDELANPRDYRQRRDPQLVRRNVTVSLENSVKNYGRHKRREIMEAFLMLAARDNSVLKQILLDPRHGSYLAVLDVLQHSTQPGVMRLVLSYLEDPHPPTSALSVLAHRADRKFIENLLRRIGSEPSAIARQNLRRVEVISWLRGNNLELLEELDEPHQHSVVQLLMASGVKRLEAFPTIEYIIRKGKPAGRRAAVAALVEFHGAEANQLLLWALEDADPAVQALALPLLRQHGVPGAMPLLIEKLESKHPLVRQAARDSLSEFSFPRFLGAFDMLEEDVRRNTGLLVKKVDKDAVALLKQEFGAPSRTRRLRAIELAEAIDCVQEVEPDLMKMLLDQDHVLRAGAARVLTVSKSAAVRAALMDAAQDSSIAVREAALASLAEVALRLPLDAEFDLPTDSTEQVDHG